MSSKLVKAGITGEVIFNVRYPDGTPSSKVAWREVEDQLLDKFYGGRANRGKGTIDSAIPLRRLLQAYEAQTAGGLMKPGLKKTNERIVKLRHAGLGWPAIQAKMVEGTTIKAVQEGYTAGGGDQPIEGRLYVRADGTLHWVGESTLAIHRARVEGATPVEPKEEPTEETKPVTVISADGETNPKPRAKRRRRAQPKAAA